jgi:hypothetical protein
MTARPRHAARRGIVIELVLLAGAFAAASAIAGLLGAVDTGTALFFGQLAFAAALVWVMLRRP